MLSDPIADMLTRIRNAVNGYKESVDIPASKFKEQLAGVLLAEGFVPGAILPKVCRIAATVPISPKRGNHSAA